VAIPFFKARNRRNYFFVALLVLMSLAAGFVHLSQLCHPLAGLGRLQPGWMSCCSSWR
jgi:uncharacterized protein involved in response to NO